MILSSARIAVVSVPNTLLTSTAHTARRVAVVVVVSSLRLWHTSHHQHDGLRVSNGEVLSHLLSLLA